MLLACTGGTVVNSVDTVATLTTLSPSEHCDAVIASVVEAGFTDEVGPVAHCRSTGCASDAFKERQPRCCATCVARYS